MAVPFSGYGTAVGLVSIMIAVSGILLGLGIASGDRKLKELGREELYQSVMNGVIVGSLFAALVPGGIIATLISSLTPAGMQCSGVLSQNYAICFANNFLVGLTPVNVSGSSYPTLMDSALSLLLPVSGIYGAVSFIASLRVDVVVASFSFSTVLQPVVSLLSYIISALSFTIASLEIQSMLLYFVAATSLPVLLPIGLVLRTFYFTRRLGGAILAVTLALFVVLPLTYVMDAQLVASYSQNAGVIGNVSLAASSIKQNVTQSLLGKSASAGVFSGISDALSSFVTYVEGELDAVMKVVALIIVEAFFLPLFSIIVTVVSARELARILGSEISFGKFDIF